MTLIIANLMEEAAETAYRPSPAPSVGDAEKDKGTFSKGGKHKEGFTRSKSGCLTCRRRKKKCDESKPYCENCRAQRIECQWPQKLIRKYSTLRASPHRQRNTRARQSESMEQGNRDNPILVGDTQQMEICSSDTSENSALSQDSSAPSHTTSSGVGSSTVHDQAHEQPLQQGRAEPEDHHALVHSEARSQVDVLQRSRDEHHDQAQGELGGDPRGAPRDWLQPEPQQDSQGPSGSDVEQEDPLSPRTSLREEFVDWPRAEPKEEQLARRPAVSLDQPEDTSQEVSEARPEADPHRQLQRPPYHQSEEPSRPASQSKSWRERSDQPEEEHRPHMQYEPQAQRHLQSQEEDWNHRHALQNTRPQSQIHGEATHQGGPGFQLPVQVQARRGSQYGAQFQLRPRPVIQSQYEALSRGHLQDLGYTQPRAPPQISQNKVRMMKGQTYDQSDAQLVYDRTRCRVLLSRFNSNGGAAVDERKKLAKGLLGSVGENVEIEAPFRCEYGYNIKIGDGTYISPDCIIEDPSIVSIGSKCFIGPRVSICCKKSSPNLNDHDGGKTLFYAPGIWIEDRVCIEAGVIIHAGVRIGRGSTIVAGSIVTKSIRERSLAGGNPAMTFQYL